MIKLHFDSLSKLLDGAKPLFPEKATMLGSRIASVYQLDPKAPIREWICVSKWINERKQLIPEIESVAQELIKQHLPLALTCSFHSMGLPEQISDQILLSLSKEHAAQKFKYGKNNWSEYIALIQSTQNREIRLEITKLFAPTIFRQLCEKIGALDFDEPARIEIAKLCADGYQDLPEHFANFEILNEMDRFEICQIAVRRKRESYEDLKLPLYICNFHLTGEHRFKIALQCASAKRSGLSKHIKYFALNREEWRIEVANLEAAESDRDFASHFRQYQITDQEVRFRFALTAAKQGRLDSISPFDLDSSHQCKFAKILAKAGACYYLATHFETYQIDDEADRFEIFKMLCNHSDSDTLSLHVPDPRRLFRITRRQFLVEMGLIVAKILAKRYGNSLHYLVNLGLEEEGDRFLIAKKFVSCGGDITSFLPLEIHDPHLQLELVRFGLLYNPCEHLARAARLLPEIKTEWNAFTRYDFDKDRNWASFLASRAAPFHKKYEEVRVKEKSTEFDDLKSSEIRYKILCFKLTLNPEEERALGDLLIQMLEIGNLEERATLKRKISLHLVDRDQFGQWFRMIKGKPIHCLYPAACFIMMEDREDRLQSWVDFVHKRGREYFRDGKKEKIFTGFFHRIYKDKQNGPRFLHFLFESEQDFLARVILLNDVYSLAPDADCNQWPNERLAEFRSQLFIKGLSLDDKDISLEKIGDLFTQWRDPNAAITYFCKIQSLKEEKTKNALLKHYGEWISNVLKGTVETWRYEASPHFKKLRELGVSDAIFEAWKEQSPLVPIHFTAEELEKPLTDRFAEFLRTNLFQFKHVEQVDTLLPYIHSLWSQEKKELLLNLVDQNLSKMGTAPAEERRRPTFRLQELMLQVLKGKGGEVPINEIKRLLFEMNQTSPVFSNFASDMAAFSIAKRFEAGKVYHYTLSTITDPQDLFLLGKETGGCQSIYYSNPEYSMCAMAYVTDPKNMPIVATDPETKTTAARSILRLLWNKKAEREVLFLEVPYTLLPTSRLNKAIERYAIDFADGLELPLYANHEKRPKEDVELCSYGSTAPFEYSDGAGGKTEGTYTIKKGYRLN
jgi:hypothetical protein